MEIKDLWAYIPYGLIFLLCIFNIYNNGKREKMKRKARDFSYRRKWNRFAMVAICLSFFAIAAVVLIDVSDVNKLIFTVSTSAWIASVYAISRVNLS